MNAKLALQIISTIGYYKDGVTSTPTNIKNIWYSAFPTRDLPKIYQKTYIDNENWINWDKAKLELYECAISYLSSKIDK